MAMLDPPTINHRKLQYRALTGSIRSYITAAKTQRLFSLLSSSSSFSLFENFDGCGKLTAEFQQLSKSNS
jgi:hypothetical protein